MPPSCHEFGGIPLKSVGQSPNPQFSQWGCTGGRVFKEMFNVSSLLWDWCLPKKRDRCSGCTKATHRGHREKVAISKPRRWAPRETHLPTPPSQTSRLQNHKTIIVHSTSHPACGALFRWPELPGSAATAAWLERHPHVGAPTVSLQDGNHTPQTPVWKSCVHQPEPPLRSKES